MCIEGLRGRIPREALEKFLKYINEDVGVACDYLMRHYRDEPWPRRTGAMPPIRRSRGNVRVELPQPKQPTMPVGQAIVRRRSADDFTGGPIGIDDLSTVLYLSVGITGWTWAYGEEKFPLRAYPSAGALQPVEVYPVINNVLGLKQGLYRYEPFTHSLEVLRLGSFGKLMAELALNQDHVSRAAAVLVFTVYYARTRWKYWKRSLRYVLLDAGAAMENAYLASVSLGLGVRAVGAFYDDELCGFLGIDCVNEFPVVMVLIGRGVFSS
ncbi:SagB/ThcOx family dehydrogenase [Vulcanisaeta thermophila]|uniref:SagB/ThcOx family dehydrogenase n=1 Tax=Vulcanisaeta thermophila TaxID=867917 RepID=UPI000853EBDD|nr:SagB/ThcOx family dehydrogenase [Vulcanisaeta thermophila]